MPERGAFMTQIRIDWSAGRREKVWRTVQAACVSSCGRFAIHRCPERGWPEGWRVSHLPTGQFIVVTKYKHEAVKAMRDLEATQGPWGSKSPKVIRAKLTEQVTPIRNRYDVRYPHLRQPEGGNQ